MPWGLMLWVWMFLWIYSICPIVKSVLDEMSEMAKQEMKDKKDDELRSWKRAVTVADGRHVAGIVKMPRSPSKTT